MSLAGILFTHVAARREGKLPFFFSRFKFYEMRERDNSHYCFACLSDVGYTPGKNGPTNHTREGGGYHGMEDHDESHKAFVIDNADKYNNPWEWLQHEVPDDFPCLIHIPQV